MTQYWRRRFVTLKRGVAVRQSLLTELSITATWFNLSTHQKAIALRAAPSPRPIADTGPVTMRELAEYLHDAFLSHNSQEKDAVEAIAKRLESLPEKDGKKLKVWLDKWDLKAGESSVDGIEKAMF